MAKEMITVRGLREQKEFFDVAASRHGTSAQSLLREPKYIHPIEA
jgi:hypothetical protein